MRIEAGKEKGRIIWDRDDWLAGLSTQFDNAANSAGLTQIDNGIPQSRSMNPYRFKGCLSPHFMPTDVSGVAIVDAVIKKAVVNGTSAYTVGAGSLMHRIATLSGTPALTNDTAGTGWPHTIDHAHSSEVGSDIALYVAKVGGTSALRGFYSFADATDWDVGTFDFATPSVFDDDFMSTAPATPLAAPYLAGGVGYPHPLIVGDDDLLYIGDRNFLHGYDGQNAADNDGKFFPAVLTLPGGFVITTMVKYQQYLVVFAYQESAGSNFYQGEAKAFFWDYLSLDPTYIYSLGDNYVSESFNFQGTIGCFTQGKPVDPAGIGIYSKVTKLQLFDGGKFKVVTNACIDKNAPIRGGVSVRGNVIQWNSQGTVYQYGTPDPSLPQVLNAIGEGIGTTTGIYATLSNTNFISTGATTSGGLQTLSTDFYHQTLVYGQLARPVFPEKMQGKVVSVTIKWGKPSSGGRNINVFFRDRIADMGIIIASSNNLRTIAAANLVTKYDEDYLGEPIGTFDAIRPAIQWEAGSGATDAPIIDSIEVDYEVINIITE